MIRITTPILLCLFALILLCGCSNQSAARTGRQIGKVLGKPLGLVVTAGDQALRTTAAIVKESWQQRKQKEKQRQLPAPPTTPSRKSNRKDDNRMLLEESVRNTQPSELSTQQQDIEYETFWH